MASNFFLLALYLTINNKIQFAM
jgi:hypothetical protein